METRPKTIIDWKVANEMLESGCYGTEVAAFFGIHEDTFYKHVKAKYGIGFTAYMQLKRSKGDGMIRKKQFDVALKGDKALLIWLGKQRLGQREPEPPQREPQTQGIFNQIIDEIKKGSKSESENEPS